MPEPRRHTVLVVNDDDAGRYSVARMLKADGFDVVEAATGEDGLRRARDLPDLVLLDVNLPDISGREVCAHLKADPWTARLPVVHLSATYVGSDHIAEGLEGGADAYLTQPVDPRELVATLRAVLRLGELERELHDKAVLLDAVVQGSLDAIYVKDLQGRYLLFNRAAEAVTGKPAAEVIGRDDTVLFPADEAAVVMRTDREIVWGGETRQVDEHVTGADGELHHFVTTKGPLLDADGRAYACFGIAHDVTQLRNADAQARRLNDELESRVERRTIELARANRELEQFVYSMAHDLRTPLRAIAGFTQLVAEDKAAQLDEGGRADLARARAAALRMADVIDALVALSQVSSRGLRRASVDLSALAAEVGARLRTDEPEREVELVVAEGLTAHADPELARIVLAVLLANALKFTSEQASARIEVGRDVTERGPAFFVRDDGAGFDMAYADKLFGTFERLHAPEEFPGRGVGLATLRRAVERHGGRVWAEGAVGRGATFWFTLPGDDDHQAATPEEEDTWTAT